MPSGSCQSVDELPARASAVLAGAERGVLGTVDYRGHPHLVPVCWISLQGLFYVPVDHKPKSSARQQRLKNLERNPEASLLLDHYEADWTRLGWVMVRGRANIEPVGEVCAHFVARYPQYADHPPQDEAIVLQPRRLLWWSWQ
jgi:PPOX class probable F420-dependent enzyme